MSLPRIAVDAMGGDEGVRVMVEGAALAQGLAIQTLWVVLFASLSRVLLHAGYRR